MEKDAKRTFNDKQKSEIFYNELAISTITGRSLWLLDSGFLFLDGIQFDHMEAHSKGGKTIVKNGTVLESNINHLKSSFKCGLTKYTNGLPNPDNFYECELFDKKIQQTLLKNCKLVPSDYYFNNAVENFLRALANKKNPYDENGKKYTRTYQYFLKVVLRKLLQWRNNLEPKYKSFNQRKLYQKEKLEIDQLYILQLTKIKDLKELKRLFEKAYIVYSHHIDLINLFYDLYYKYFEINFNFFYSNFINKNKIDEYISLFFKDYFQLLKYKKTIPRYKNIALQEIEFLRKYTKHLLSTRYTRNIYSKSSSTKFYTSSYQAILKRKKNKNDIYIQVSRNLGKMSNVKSIEGICLNKLLNHEDVYNWNEEFGNYSNSLSEYKKNLSFVDLENFVNAVGINRRINIFLLCHENLNEIYSKEDEIKSKGLNKAGKRKKCHRTILAEQLNKIYNLNIQEYTETLYNRNNV